MKAVCYEVKKMAVSKSKQKRMRMVRKQKAKALDKRHKAAVKALKAAKAK